MYVAKCEYLANYGGQIRQLAGLRTHAVCALEHVRIRREKKIYKAVNKCYVDGDESNDRLCKQEAQWSSNVFRSELAYRTLAITLGTCQDLRSWWGSSPNAYTSECIMLYYQHPS